MSIIRLISRLFVGFVFIFSGFVKGVDPLGSTYKFTDYFTAFGMNWAEPLAFVLGILLSFAEFIIGIGLFFNLKIKTSAWGALLFMLFFTPLTFILALYNPVTDCGCFGDAMKLTNWETFWKNVIIIIPAIIVFAGRKNIKCFLTSKFQWIFIGVFTLFISSISYYSFNHLPIIDFRPFKVGTYLPEKMVYPPDAEPDVYETKFIYKNLKTGEEKEFDQTNYPWADTLNWAWVDSKSELVKEGYHPPIHDFTMNCGDEGDITDLVLHDNRFTFLLISHNLKKASLKNSDIINNIFDYCNTKNYRFISLTSSVQEDINKFANDAGAKYKFCSTDEITLKTIIRANPGLLLLHKGTVIAKWHYNDFPTINELKEIGL